MLLERLGGRARAQEDAALHRRVEIQPARIGSILLDTLLPPVQSVFGITGTTFLVVETIAFGLVFGAFWLAFFLVVTGFIGFAPAGSTTASTT